jgi:hypothetical protein
MFLVFPRLFRLKLLRLAKLRQHNLHNPKLRNRPVPISRI